MNWEKSFGSDQVSWVLSEENMIAIYIDTAK